MSNTAKTGLLVSLLAMSITIACATSDTSSTATAASQQSAPGGAERIGDLVKVEIDVDGELYIRENHQIGGFDAVHFQASHGQLLD